MDSDAEFHGVSSPAKVSASKRLAPREMRAPILHRDYRKPFLMADMAEARDFIENHSGGNTQSVYHLDTTTCERLINPGPFRDVQLAGSIDVSPTFPVGG
jgi:hypothetical protein